MAGPPTPFGATGLRLAPVQPGEYSAVAALFGRLHALNATFDPRFALAEGWRELLSEHFARTQANPAALWLLAWHGDQPVGLLVVEAHQDSPLFRHRDWAELVALYVDDAYRGMGLGRRLLDEARAWAAWRGFERVQLYVTASNEPARALYRRYGLRPVQEIWRLEVQPRPGVEPPADASCAPEQWGLELLETGHHHLAGEARHAGSRDGDVG